MNAILEVLESIYELLIDIVPVKLIGNLGSMQNVVTNTDVNNLTGEYLLSEVRLSDPNKAQLMTFSVYDFTNQALVAGYTLQFKIIFGSGGINIDSGWIFCYNGVASATVYGDYARLSCRIVYPAPITIPVIQVMGQIVLGSIGRTLPPLHVVWTYPAISGVGVPIPVNRFTRSIMFLTNDAVPITVNVIYFPGVIIPFHIAPNEKPGWLPIINSKYITVDIPAPTALTVIEAIEF